MLYLNALKKLYAKIDRDIDQVDIFVDIRKKRLFSYYIGDLILYMYVRNEKVIAAINAETEEFLNDRDIYEFLGADEDFPIHCNRGDDEKGSYIIATFQITDDLVVEKTTWDDGTYCYRISSDFPLVDPRSIPIRLTEYIVNNFDYRFDTKLLKNTLTYLYDRFVADSYTRHDFSKAVRTVLDGLVPILDNEIFQFFA